MNSFRNGIIMGTISCIAPSTMHKESRILMHKKQLGCLEHITQIMVDTHGLDPIPYYRVEQGWEPETQEQLKTTLPLISLRYDNPIPPGAARNALLTELYDSDADWLIMMDDDQGICDTYAGYEFLWELSSKPLLDNCCRKLIAISSFPAYWDGFRSEVEKFGKSGTHWLLKPTKHRGYMAFACIPNVYKYTGKKVFFDATTTASSVGEVPEDLKFMIDWIKAGGFWYECWMLAGKSMGALEDSSIFRDDSSKSERNLKWVPEWAASYLKTLYPRQPQLWDLKEFFRRKNPRNTLVIPRQRKVEVDW